MTRDTPLAALLLAAALALLLSPFVARGQAPFPIAATQYVSDTWNDVPLYQMTSRANAADVMYTTGLVEYQYLTGAGGAYAPGGAVGYVCPALLQNYQDTQGRTFWTAPVYQLTRSADGAHVYTMNRGDLAVPSQYADDVNELWQGLAGTTTYEGDQVNPNADILPYALAHPYALPTAPQQMQNGPVFYVHIAAPTLGN